MSDGDAGATYVAGLLRDAQRGELEDQELEHTTEAAVTLRPEEIEGFHSLRRAFHDVDGWDFEDLEFYDDVLAEAGDRTTTKAVWNKNAPVMQNRIGRVDHGIDETEGWARLERELKQGGFTGLIQGGTNNGKTDFMLRTAERWAMIHARPRHAIITNVPVLEDDITYVESESEAYDAAEDVDGKVYLVLDEPGREGAGDKYGNDAQAFEDFLKEIRKEPWLGSCIASMHDDVDVGKSWRTLADVGVRKPNVKTAVVYESDLDGDLFDGDSWTIQGVKSTRIDYNEGKSPSWAFDAEHDEEEDVDPEDARDQERKRIAQRRRFPPEADTAGEIAEDLPYGQDWVYKHTFNPEDYLERALDLAGWSLEELDAAVLEELEAEPGLADFD